MNASEPAVSIVIPTHNRATSLNRTLEALARQDYAAGSLELVVVADACSDETVRLLEGSELPFGLQFVETPGVGPGAARNQGAALAGGELLLFLDDDIVPAPDLVTAHVSAHRRQPGQIVLGPYPPALDGAPDLLHILTRHWWADKFAGLQAPGHRFHYSDVLGGNMSLERQLFLALGGFDTDFRFAHEDLEFGLRAIRAETAIAFVPDAHADHFEHETTTVGSSLRRARHEGQADALIALKYPELRASLEEAGGDEERRPFVARIIRRAASSPLSAILDSLAALSSHTLPVAEMLRMRGAWAATYGALRAYWYWRGVCETLGADAPRAMAAGTMATSERGDVAAVSVDLWPCLDAAVRQLDDSRPLAVRLFYNTQYIGEISPVAGAEPLRGAHLAPILLRDFAAPLAEALAADPARSRGGPIVVPHLVLLEYLLEAQDA